MFKAGCRWCGPKPQGLIKRNYIRPPTYFNKPGLAGQPAQNVTTLPLYAPPVKPSKEVRKPFLEIATGIAVLVLSFFALDNYRIRLGLESKLEDQLLKIKSAQELYNKQINAQRKKRELQILNERKQMQMRQMKISLHVALLRKQLLDHDIQPVSIEDALQEYEKSVRMENSISNVSGTSLWVIDDSPTKAFVPNAREYDSKKENS
ncbi:LAFE_0C02960g1_1 [Lachancea fermentati]|uniref:LAFE_0C02960g1_1 n=1 Tax=Lachancea fermentati TaxID=4955 RepID=A0A1G4M945_LACFM|nr:LAFE_0C02960g1_1 [Lachancea fermentati]